MNDISKKWFVFIGITLLSFGCYLDYTIVNIALPTLQQELQTDLSVLQWVMNSYFLALCVLATIMGRCGDLYGRRRCFYIGVGIFAIASIIAGLAPTISWLIFGRLLQGIGAALVFPLGPSLLHATFPIKEREKAIAWLGSMGGIALALGPVIGGMIVTYWGWRWIFFINIPIIFLGYLFCRNSIHESVSEQRKLGLDWKGMVLLGFAISGIVLNLIHNQQTDWLFFGIAIIASLFFIYVEKHQENPLIDFKDFSNLLFFAGAALVFLAGILSSVALFFDPLYLQIIQGQSPQFSGFILFAIPVTVLILAFMMGWLTSHLGLMNTILVGLLIACLSALFQLFFSNTTSLWFILVAFIFLGCVWAMGNTVPIMVAQIAVKPERISVATGTMITLFNIGGSIGLAMATVMYNTAAALSLLTQQTRFTPNQFQYLEKLIYNPAESIQATMTNTLRHVFHKAFLQGFSGAMWFLLIFSSILLIIILGWNLYQRKRA